jgi:probable non-F420 flavinoid oxidoreductase
MAIFGYHASHEQFKPGDLLRWVQLAEQAGFQAGMCSDHFHPWNNLQGQSGFAWSWLGAALQATSLPFGTVCAPGQRYHPAIIAQAAATLADMYPGRFWVALGSGEALNEHITGDPWPSKAERNQRLKESVDVMRALWAGETVTHRGLVQVGDARLYTRPQTPPRIVGAAVTAETAEWVAGWADALITVNQPREKLQPVVDAFRRGGGEGKPMFLQVHVSYAKTEEEALRTAHEQWRSNCFDSQTLADLRMPEDFEAAASSITPEDVRKKSVRVSSDLAQHVAWLHDDIALGFEQIYLHNVNHDQERFIDAFGEKVLPQAVNV